MHDNSNSADASEQRVQLIEYCSYKHNYSESITKGTGVEKLCQVKAIGLDETNTFDNGWILINNNQEETLIVSFRTAVFINEIHIYESLNAGSIVKLEALESRMNKWRTLWQEKSKSAEKPLSCQTFKPRLRRYRFKSRTVRITIDPTYTDQIGIQDIKLFGTNTFDSMFCHVTLKGTMVDLYKQVLSNVQLDTQFLIDDKIINVHRNILCCRSSYFCALLFDDFTEKTQRKPIELTDVDYQTFVELLHFVYTGTYHEDMSYESAIKCMIYSNKINFLAGKNAALDKICDHLSLNHNLIVSLYTLAKQMSPEFDALLDYIYNLTSHRLTEICSQKEFSELDKESMVDFITQSLQRHDARDQEKL